MKDPKKTQPTKPTIRHVALDAGVSTAAVSKVLRNAYGVSDKLREKVLESIARLGYRPNIAARGMRGKTYTVGILLIEMTNPFLASVVEGIQSVLGEAGYKSMIGVGQAKTKIESSLIDTMSDFRMDGLILVAPRISGDLLEGFARQLPLVVIGHHEATAQAFDTVNSDDLKGGRIATEALIGRGHKRIHMISAGKKGSNESEVFKQREQGYFDAMTGADLAAQARVIRYPTESDRSAFSELLEAPDRPTAYFCWSDLHAIELINQAHVLGIRVPEELAIVGYDNSPVGELPMINLASVDQNGAQIGATAAQTLLARIGGEAQQQHVLIEPLVIARGSL